MKLNPLTAIIAIAVGIATAAIVILVAGCERPIARKLASQGPASLCTTVPKKIYFGSCGDKMIKKQGQASCVLCQDVRGCLAFPGTYCVGDLSCDDNRCE